MKQHREQHLTNNSKLAHLILKYRYVVMFIVVFLIIGSGGYVLFTRINNNTDVEILQKIEELEELYTDVFSDNDYYEDISDATIAQVDNLISQLDSITQEYKNRFGVQDAYFKKGTLYLLKKQYQEAFSEFELSLEQGKNSSYLIPKILLYMASISEELDKEDEAISYYQKIVDNHPNSLDAPHAMISLGRIAESTDKENNTDTAQGYYLFLIQNEQWQDSNWASIAKSRLASLGYTGYSDTASDE